MEQFFTFSKIGSPEVLEEAFRLRYHVYCNERRFINPQDCPDGCEMDENDFHSVHFGAFVGRDQMIGVVRLILPTCGRFPLEDRCPGLVFGENLPPRHECAEISRLTISKLYRRRANDGLYYEPQVEDRTVEDKGVYFLRRVRPMAFGLYREMYRASKRIGVRYWFALMEKTLWMLLKIHGFVFKPIGPEVDFYGLVMPYVADIQQLERDVRQKFPKFYEFFIKDLEPELLPKF